MHRGKRFDGRVDPEHNAEPFPPSRWQTAYGTAVLIQEEKNIKDERHNEECMKRACRPEAVRLVRGCCSRVVSQAGCGPGKVFIMAQLWIVLVSFGLVLPVSRAPVQGGPGANADSLSATPSSFAEGQAWQILKQGVASPKTGRRISAINALATIPENKDAVHLVTACLKDHDAQVRKSAARKLAEMHATSAIPDLRNALEDYSDEVSFAAALALLDLGDSTGRRVLLDVLSGKRHPSPGFAESEKQALAKKMHSPMGMTSLAASATPVPGVGSGVHMIQGLMKDRTSIAKIAAANALAADQDSETTKRLEAALNDSHLAVRTAVAKALGEHNGPGVISHLQSRLHDSHTAVRDMAAASIIRISRADAAAADPPSQETKPVHP